MSREQLGTALLNALIRFRVVVETFTCAERRAERLEWVNKQIAMLGHAGQIEPPAVWNIYEPHLRDEIAKVMKAVELYNAGAERPA